LFKGFGSDLPPMTSFIVGNVGVLAGMLVLIFLVQIAFYIRFLIAKNAISRRVVAWCGFANIVFQFITVYAMYAPIFKLGTVV
jgi:type II secretory pathway component PulF